MIILNAVVFSIAFTPVFSNIPTWLTHHEDVNKFCMDLSSQEDVDSDAILGMWFVREIIYHRRVEILTEHSNSCPKLHLRNVEPPIYPSSTARYRGVDDSYNRNSRFGVYDPSYRYLNIVWEESGNNRVYRVKFNNTRRGFWLSSAPSNEYLNKEYNYFAGTVQVLKAVNNHLVLSFCQRLPHSELFSVILARGRYQLMEMELLSIHNLLNRKNLATSFMKKVCTNGANDLNLSFIQFLTSILMCVFALNF